MPRVNLIGSSNRYTNQTCVFGSMAGLAPTKNVRPFVSGIPGYKHSIVAANGNNWTSGEILTKDKTALENGCGLGKYKNACNDGVKCLKHLNLYRGSFNNYGRPGTRGPLLG